MTWVLVLAWAVAAGAQQNPDFTREIAPFRIADGLYYVGSADLAAYLVVTPQGDILINSNLETSPPQIARSVAALGQRLGDIKVLLISQAHFDHVAGSAEMVRRTGARYMVMDADVAAIESGGKRGTPRPDFTTYPPAKVDRILHDGDTVRLGGTVLTAHKTAGHTPGCTTWTMRARDRGREYSVLILGGPGNNRGTPLVGNKLYPDIAADFAHGFETLRALPCDIFLGAHGAYFGLAAKRAALQPGGPNPFVDPSGCRTAITQAQTYFEAALARDRAAAR